LHLLVTSGVVYQAYQTFPQPRLRMLAEKVIYV